jgi:hypothetical protein
MWLPGRVILGLLAVFIAWTILRAWRSGQVFSNGWGYSLDDQPILYTLTMAAHAGGVVWFLWLAAGYDTASFLHLFGLDAFAPAPR